MTESIVDRRPPAQEIFEAVMRAGEVDLSAVKILAAICVGRIKDHGAGKPASRALSLAITKLEEATFWIDEHQRLS